jgi:hypothetical protein
MTRHNAHLLVRPLVSNILKPHKSNCRVLARERVVLFVPVVRSSFICSQFIGYAADQII